MGHSGNGTGCLGCLLALVFIPMCLMLALPLILFQQADGRLMANPRTYTGAPMDFWYDTSGNSYVPLPRGHGCGANSLPKPLSISMAMPVLSAVSSPFGLRSDPFTQEIRCHGGIDFAAPLGTPVVSVADGVVAAVVPTRESGGFGNLVRLDHGDGVESWYAHLSRVLVQDGEGVHQGDIVGLVGSTGRSTGPHLHFEVRVDGSRVDPALVLGSDVQTPRFQRVVRVMATAYASASAVDGPPSERGILVDETIIPSGSALYIPGYGSAVATTAPDDIQGHRIAIPLATPEEAIQFGRRLILLYVVGE